MGEPCESTDSFVGRIIDGKYLILERIGSGGVSVVYKAAHTMLGRTVALKVLRTDLAGDATVVRRFEREAKIIGRLKHPNATVLYDFGIEDRLRYLVMEHAVGQTLREVLDERGPLPFEYVSEVLKQICSALDEAHRLGIVHRDLKPSNVMILDEASELPAVKVLDFGIAKVFGQDGEYQQTQITASGSLTGTPEYMSPEQALEEDVGPRSDIYSLGLLLREMLTGCNVFAGGPLVSVMYRQVNETPPELIESAPEGSFPQELEELIARALAKEPEQRFESVTELYEGFVAAIASKSSAEGKLIESAVSSKKRSNFLHAAVACVLLVSLGVFAQSVAKEPPVVSAPEALAAKVPDSSDISLTGAKKRIEQLSRRGRLAEDDSALVPIDWAQSSSISETSLAGPAEVVDDYEPALSETYEEAYGSLLDFSHLLVSSSYELFQALGYSLRRFETNVEGVLREWALILDNLRQSGTHT